MTKLEAWKYIKQRYEDKLEGKQEPYNPALADHRLVRNGICCAVTYLDIRQLVERDVVGQMRDRIAQKLDELHCWPYLADYNPEGDKLRVKVLAEFIAELE